MRQHWMKNCGWGVLLLATWALATGVAWAQGFGGGGFGGGGFGRSRTSANYPSGTAMGTATFTTDPETRKLVVVTDEETALYISQVVSNLDRPAPQVLIKVVFVEATYRNGLDFGVEGASKQQVNDTTVGRYAQAFKGIPGLSSGGAMYTIAGTDFEVTLKAIAENGKLEVLSRPSILARNNQQAVITVGQYVPLVTGVSYNINLGQLNSITYQNVGIILRVTPFVTSEGMVEMIVSPEISNLSDQTVNISTGTNAVGAPIINTRSADTVVLTPSGQTVVIGGLMQNTKAETISKVPVLGDIPLLGLAFRRKVSVDSKTELLMFLTPYIVKQPAQLAAMTAAEKADTEIIPQSFSEKELNRYLEAVPQKTNAPPSGKRK
jgi:type II secretory pathway component GspD/PulD (secretin)